MDKQVPFFIDIFSIWLSFVAYLKNIPVPGPYILVVSS
jgi:hypothetical protein